MTLFNRNTSKILMAVLLVSTVAAVGLAGIGSATVTTDTANFMATGTDTLSNQEFAVDNDTRSIYIDLDNSAYNATEPVNATFYGVDADGNETQVDKVQLEAGADSVESFEYTAIEPGTYDSYRLQVKGSSSAVESAALDVGTVQEISGGGGLLGGSAIGGVPIVAIVALGGAYLLFVRD